MVKYHLDGKKLNRMKETIKNNPEILSCIGILSPRERWIFNARSVGMIMERIGAKFGVTRERIRQIEYKIICKLVKESNDFKRKGG